MDDQWVNPAARKPGKGLWIAAILLVLAVCAFVFLFCMNRFSLELEVAGDPEMILEYGETYREEGVRPVIRSFPSPRKGSSTGRSWGARSCIIPRRAMGFRLRQSAQSGWWTPNVR